MWNPEVEIPLIFTPKRGEIFRPTPDDPQGAINAVLAGREFIYTKSLGDVKCQYGLIPYPATSPHTVDEEHIVYWAAKRQSQNKILSWDKTDWNGLERDKYFLTGVDEMVNELQKINPLFHCYSVFGYANPNLGLHEELFHRGLQSQERFHMHGVIPYKHFHTIEILRPDNPKHIDRLGMFTGKAADRSQDYYSRYLRHFGHEFTYLQEIGVNGVKDTLERRLFGFESFAQAFETIRSLQKQITLDNWQNPKHTSVVKSIPVFLGENELPIKQARVPGFSIVIPNYQDRKKIKKGDVDYRVWVQAFSVCGPPPILCGGFFEAV